MGQVVYDKLLNKVLLHRHDPLVLKDSNGIYWDVTVDTAGALVVTQEASAGPGTAGQPIGLFPYILTYAS
jgi:hypothetical protein